MYKVVILVTLSDQFVLAKKLSVLHLLFQMWQRRR